MFGSEMVRYWTVKTKEYGKKQERYFGGCRRQGGRCDRKQWSSTCTTPANGVFGAKPIKQSKFYRYFLVQPAFLFTFASDK